MLESEWPQLLQQLKRTVPDDEHRSIAIEKLLRKTPRWQDTSFGSCLAFCRRVAWRVRIDPTRRRDLWGIQARNTRLPEPPAADRLTPHRVLELKEETR